MASDVFSLAVVVLELLRRALVLVDVPPGGQLLDSLHGYAANVVKVREGRAVREAWKHDNNMYRMWGAAEDECHSHTSTCVDYA